MPLKKYKPGSAINGVIGRTFDQSSPAWPEPLRAREGAPNVLFIILDDTGFDQLGGPNTFNHYAWGWTWAGNIPFRRWKRKTYRDGMNDPFIVYWPKGI